ncbi:membrane peptidoglycan carboxypeptidase [Saccharopolyspora dendranthemae]|uniref:Membrane peptidoglycan carboxypeptidase n=1 Tax=Saccharopolyspora dendranthemae TaxID=1181886 RepID=A0A561U4M9_9PSEU|nr:transglycosylase domain-containing protein [Saccharopolyspora dendranthemae]TWF94319.1 membrane peptidoglycan carboxypeptidase [Saccharopolyspora dendranthemae]
MRVRDGLLKLFGLCVLAGVLVAGLLFPAAGSLGVVSNRAGDAVNSISTDMMTKEPPLVTTITDKDGRPIAYLFNQDRTPAAPDQIADTMKAAIVAIEDRRFFDHQGVDWAGTARAAVTNQMSGEIAQGGSTLTQQYVKNYLVHVVAADDPVKQAKAIEQTPGRKLREIRIALQVEKQINKEQILARYLNVVPYGNQAYGISAAARTYFGTTPDKLTIAQSALLAGMVNSPSALNPETSPDEAINRRNLVIQAMQDQRRITPEAADEARNAPLGLVDPLQNIPNGCVGAGPSDGFFCRYVIDYLERAGFTEEQLKSGGYNIRTSMDKRATDAAKEAAERGVPKTTKGIANVMSIVEPGKDKHRVRALVANRDFGIDASKGQTSYALPSGIAKFGAGSIYKVFTAAAALEKGMGIYNTIQSPGSYTSQVYRNGSKPYTVGNAEGVAPGPRTLQKALATSPNTAFVALQERVGLDPTVDMAVRLGMRQTLLHNTSAGDPVTPNNSNGLSQAEDVKQKNIGAFTLGFAPTSPLELSNVGATIMSGGTWCPPTPIEQILDRNGNPVSITEDPCEQAVDEPLANAMAIGMSKDDQGGGTAEQAASGAGWSRPVASKTGTTEAHQSAGFLGATPQYAGSVLTFSDGTSPQGICDSDPPTLCGANGGNIYGGKVPARTWFNAMKVIHEGLPVEPLPDTTDRYENGGDEFQVPNVVGLTSDKAKERLEQAGYKVVERSVNSQRKKGSVTSQTPRGFALPGETVTVSVSTGYVPPPSPERPPPQAPPPVAGQPPGQQPEQPGPPEVPPGQQPDGPPGSPPGR